MDLNAADPTSSPKDVEGHQGVVFDAEFFPAGFAMATASADGTARITAAGADGPPRNLGVLKGHEDVVYRVAFAGDGRYLVTSSLDGETRLWRLRGGFSASPLRLTTSRASGMTMSRDGRWLFAGDRVWDLTSEESALTPFNLPALTVARADRANFSTDGQWLLVSVEFPEEDGVFAWDLRGKEPQMIGANLTADSGVRAGWRISRDGRWVVVQTRSEKSPKATATRLWNLSTLSDKASPVITAEGNGRFDSVDISNDSRWLATVADGRTIRLWNLTSPNPSESPVVLQSDESIASVRFDPENRWLIAGNWDGAQGHASLRLWDLSGSRPEAVTHRLTDSDPIGSVSVSPKSRWLVTGSWDGSTKQKTARLWDLNASNLAGSRVVLDHGQAIDHVVFDPNNKWLATAAVGNSISFWDLTRRSMSSPSLTVPLQGKGTTISVQFSPDSHWATVSVYGQPPQLVDLTARRPAAPLLGHRHPVVRAAISPDSRWLVTADTDLEPPDSAEQTCRIWSLTAPDPAASAAVLPRQECQADQLVITPNGRWLVTSGRSGVRLWHLGLETLLELAQRTAGRTLSAEERKEFVPLLR